MAKVADVQLTWMKSPSPNVVKQVLTLVVDGQQTVSSVGPEVESVTITAKAQQAVRFKVTTTNKDGLNTDSIELTFTLDDLAAPAPATALDWTIVGVRDVDDEPTPAPTP